MTLAMHGPVLAQGRWFAALSEEVRDALLARAVVRRHPSGARLFSRGDANAGLFCVLDGAVEIGAVDLAGRESLLDVLQAAQWFGEIALFDDGPRTHDATTKGATTLLLVPAAELRRLVEADPALWRTFGALVVEKVRALFLGSEGAGTLSAGVRVARRLHGMTTCHGMLVAGCVRSTLAINQQQLGAMLGLTRQTVSEVLRQLEGDGIVKRRYGAIEVLDLDALHGIAVSA